MSTDKTQSKYIIKKTGNDTEQLEQYMSPDQRKYLNTRAQRHYCWFCFQYWGSVSRAESRDSEKGVFMLSNQMNMDISYLNWDFIPLGV